MADKKISALPAAAALNGSEQVPVVQNGATVRTSVDDILGELIGTYVAFAQLSVLLDAIVTGAITRDVNGAATSAPVIWPDGAVGTYTADTLSTSFPGAVDAYHVTYGSPVTRTYTQPAVTRDGSGAVTTRPAIVVT